MSTIVTLEGTLTPRAPFDFAKTLQFVGDFTPMEGEQTISDNVLTKAVMLNGRAVAFQVRNLGSVEEPQVAYTLFSARPLTEIEHEMLRDRIRFFLSLDDDLQPFYAVGRTDTHFAPVIQSLYGLHQPKFLTPFELACWAILTQRTPIAIAHRMKMALVARGGRSIILPEGVYRAFPEPQELAGMNIDELFSLVRNVRKSEYLYEVIRFFNEADEQYLCTGEYNEVAARIRSIRGVGEWSAYFILIRGLGRIERIPLSGKEFLNAASHVYQREVTSADLEQLAARYGTKQGYWSFYLRASALLGHEVLPI